jgi:LPS export ABC transporter protein LptC
MRPARNRASILTGRAVGLAAAAAALVLLHGLVTGWDDSDVERAEAGAQRGYYATDATITETGKDGHPRFIAHARSVEQQLPDQSVLMQDMTLDYPTADHGTWHVTAPSGLMPADRKSVELYGGVTITGADSGHDAVIRAERVNYRIDDAIVSTAAPVTLSYGTHELKARGLEAKLNAGTLRLESDVNGRFTP